MVPSAAADPGRGPGCSQTCAVATSPAPPPGQPVHTVSTVGPPVHASGRVTRGTKVMVSGKAPAALPGSLALSPQGDRPLGCQMAADRGERGHRDAAATSDAAGLGEQLRRCGKQQSPGTHSRLAPAHPVVAILCPGLANLCGQAGAGGGHGPPGQGSILGHCGVQHAWAVLVQYSPEHGSVPRVSSSSSWACHWE